MSIDTFEGYLERLEHDFDADEDNEAIDIEMATSWGHEYTVSLVEAKMAYVLFVSPLVELGDEPDVERLYERMLEINDERRFVKLALDGDGDVKLSAEGFTRLDTFGQFRRRLDAIAETVESHGKEIAELADDELG